MGITTTAKQRTLGELRQELMILNGAMIGASFGFPLFDAYLQRAQRELYPFVDWHHLRTANEQPTQIGEKWHDLPDDCDLERLSDVRFKTAGSTQWFVLSKGINLSNRSFSPAGYPFRYEIRHNPSAPSLENPVQIEIYPSASAVGLLRIEYIKRCERFTQDGDEASLPDELVLLHALYNMKLAKGAPDAQALGDQLGGLLRKIKSQHRTQDVFAPHNENAMFQDDIVYTYPQAV